ncbi:MAG TPA: PIG-L deacetylase family protein [Acidimicrobiales bacterium]|nr:PIG-L deacetylase family protein [Acidimicrobiales bacterium]
MEHDGSQPTSVARAGEQVVVVVAHPDDETFGCGSLIAQAVADGARVRVICCTRGEAGERVPDPTTDHLPLGDVREAELRAAGEVLGVERIDLLPHADSGFDGDLAPGTLCAVPVEQLADDLATRFAELGPDVVVVLDGSDGHRDHLHVLAAVQEATARPGAAPVRLVQTSLPNSIMRLWVEEMRATRPDTVYLELDVDALGRPDAELTEIDTSAVLATREQAIACHRSQHTPFDGLSPDLRRAFLATTHVTIDEVGPA